MQRRIGVTKELTGRAEQSLLRWFGHTRGLIGEENNSIRCEFERKTTNEMDRW